MGSRLETQAHAFVLLFHTEMIALVLSFAASVSAPSFLGAAFQEQEPAPIVEVATLKEIGELDKDVKAVELRFKVEHDQGMLQTLATTHPKLETLVLRSSGRSGVRPLQYLVCFEELQHLEIHDPITNLCYVGKGSEDFELQVIGELVGLRTLILDLE